MKNLLFILLFLGTSTALFAGTSVNQPDQNSVVQQVNIEKLDALQILGITNSESSEFENFFSIEDGIGCKVRDADGQVIASCFICNCSKLAETVLNSGD